MISLRDATAADLGPPPPPGDLAPHVLVVEDDPLVCDMLQQTLAFGGYRTTGALDGREALRCLDRADYDAVVTDIVMPHVDGVELIQHLRRCHPRIGVVAVSGDSDADSAVYLRIARHLGVGATVAKPFGALELLSAVAQALAVRRA